MKIRSHAAAIAVGVLVSASAAEAADVCQKFGPQTPRDIASAEGSNARAFPIAPGANNMNLCNIHFHLGAEHKGPAFKEPVTPGSLAGFKCDESASLTPAELKPIEHGACHGTKPGDTIEMHWVYTSCDVAPGEGLGACSSAACANPTLRVESQVFVLVNDPAASNFAEFDYPGAPSNGLHQPKQLPGGTPVVYRGSTTGPKFDDQTCSPLQVTWSVRPTCAKLDINSLNHWCESNVFKENHGHGVRKLVVDPALLDKIQ